MPDVAADLGDLVRQHERRLYGFFRVRVGDDSAAGDLAQETWVEVLGHGDTFDPGLGSFWTFTRIWAGFVLRRHWEARGRERERERGDGGPSGNDEPYHPDPGERFDARVLAAEDATSLSRALRQIVCCAFACPRPPNEIIAFGFTKLEWKPREITMNLSDSTLDELASRLERDYVALVPDPEIAAAFEPLRGKLEQSFADLVSDPRSKRAYAHVPDGPTGPIELRAYFAPDANAESTVTRWWDTVKRAVFRQLREQGALGQAADGPGRAGPAGPKVHGATS